MAISNLADALPELSLAWLAGHSVAFVGKLGGVTRKRARQIVRDGRGVTLDSAEDPAVDLIVVGADQSLADDYAALLSEQVLARADQGSLEIISETEWWRRLGVVDEDGEAARRLYTPAMLSDLLSVPLKTIRRWHRKGLIQPVMQVHRLPYFDFEEVAAARQLARLVASGHSPQLIETRLTRLAGKFPGLRLPLSRLSMIVEGGEVLLRQSGGLVEPGGQLRIDFDALGDAGSEQEPEEELDPGPSRPHVVGFPVATEPERPAMPTTAEDFLALASDLEDEARSGEAAEVYRTMMLALGASAEGSFRLAELLYSMGELPAARERYSVAIELAPDYVEARASLGCVLVELGLLDQAAAAFEGALELHPEYPDVHYHLARLRDELNQPSVAAGHWHSFLRLAPQSPWSGEARQRLGMDVHRPETVSDSEAD